MSTIFGDAHSLDVSSENEWQGRVSLLLEWGRVSSLVGWEGSLLVGWGGIFTSGMGYRVLNSGVGEMSFLLGWGGRGSLILRQDELPSP